MKLYKHYNETISNKIFLKEVIMTRQATFQAQSMDYIISH